MESGEEPEEACIREIFEETGFKIAIKKLITAKSAKTVCALVYEVEVIGGTLKMSDESLDVRWFPLKNIPWDEMAFESHSSVLKNWLRNRGNDE